MYPHRIRLRGPWECEPAGIPPRRVNMPCTWTEAGLSGHRGIVRFVRKFGYPGKADPEFEHIWLTCDGCTDVMEVRLNGALLNQSIAGTFAFDVTPLMAERNQLEVVIDAKSEDAGLWGEVALEIRKDAFLANVAAEFNANQLTVTGEVVGAAPQPLEMYILVDNRHADYRKILPSLNGTPFRIELPEMASTCGVVRVEIVHVSAVWYAVEVSISHWQSA
jgi:hypothetical protein